MTHAFEPYDWNALYMMTLTDPDDAAYIAGIHESCLLVMMDLIAKENALLAAGQVEEALAMLDVKQNSAVEYARSTDLMRRNLVAMTRWIPNKLADLKRHHQELMELLNANAKLISTLRTLSESLLRSVAHDTQAKQRVSTYGQNGRETRPTLRAPSSAIIVSTSL